MYVIDRENRLVYEGIAYTGDLEPSDLVVHLVARGWLLVPPGCELVNSADLDEWNRANHAPMGRLPDGWRWAERQEVRPQTWAHREGLMDGARELQGTAEGWRVCVWPDGPTGTPGTYRWTVEGVEADGEGLRTVGGGRTLSEAQERARACYLALSAGRSS